MWTSLESFMLSKALDTHRKLNQPHDVEWIHILLSFLKTYIDHGGEDLLMHEDDKVEYVSKLIAAMKVAASDLETGMLTYFCLLQYSNIKSRPPASRPRRNLIHHSKSCAFS